MGWTDWLIPAGIIGAGALTSLIGSEKAASAQTDAANQAADVQREMFQTTRSDYAPYRDIGANALYQLAAGTGVEYEGAPGTIEDRYQTAMSRFAASPSYQFRLNEGLKALDQSASARGKLLSGSQQKAITDYGQGLASTEWDNYLNRLASQAGIGQTSTAQLGAVGAQTAANTGNALMAAGGARASGYAGGASGINNALQNAMYMYGRA